MHSTVAVPDVAANAGDDADRQFARDQHRSLLDMQVRPRRRRVLAIEQRLAVRDAVDVGADIAHAIAQRPPVTACGDGQIVRGRGGRTARCEPI